MNIHYWGVCACVFVNRKDQLVQSLQSELRAAPKQEFVEHLEQELTKTKTSLNDKSEEYRR